MAIEQTTCGICGEIFRYRTGLFTEKPTLGDGFIGYICPDCVDRKRNQEIQEQGLTLQREKLQESRNRSELENLKFLLVQQQRNIDLDRSEKFQLDLEREKILKYAEIERRRQNPGEYECISCRFNTLKYRSSICTGCRVSIPLEYWIEVDSEQAKKIEASRAAEALRIQYVNREIEIKNKEIQEAQHRLSEAWLWETIKGLLLGAAGGLALGTVCHYVLFAVVGLLFWDARLGETVGGIAFLSIIVICSVFVGLSNYKNATK